MAVDRKEAAKTVAQHHTTLCLLDAIAELANRSDMHHSAQRTGSRIAALCRAEQQRQLKRYDAALARVTSGVAAVEAPSTKPCPECSGGSPGLVDDGSGGFATCEECGGTGRVPLGVTAASALRPLTLDRIEELWEALEHKAPVYLARAVEAAHGIGVEGRKP